MTETDMSVRLPDNVYIARGAHSPGDPGAGDIYRELKIQRGRLSRHQKEWLAALQEAGQDATVWRPSDWHSGRITRELQAVAR